MGEVAGALFDNMVDDTVCFAFIVFVWIGDFANDAEGISVERRLGNKAVGEGNPEDAGNECGEAEEKDVPMEARGFSERKFGALGYQG